MDPLFPAGVNNAMDPIAASQQPQVTSVSPTAGLSDLSQYIDQRFNSPNRSGLSSTLDDATGKLTDLVNNPEVDNRSKWFKFASAIGRPTKSGRFAEAASSGLDALTDAESQQFQLKQQYKVALQNKLQQQALTQLNTYDQQEMLAREHEALYGTRLLPRGAGAMVSPDGWMKPQNVRNVGLTQYNQLTGETRVLASSNSDEYIQLRKVLTSQADKMNFTNSDDKRTWVDQQTEDIMGKAQGYSSGPQGPQKPLPVGNQSSSGAVSPLLSKLQQARDFAVSQGRYDQANQITEQMKSLRSPVGAGGPTVSPNTGAPIDTEAMIRTAMDPNTPPVERDRAKAMLAKAGSPLGDPATGGVQGGPPVTPATPAGALPTLPGTPAAAPPVTPVKAPEVFTPGTKAEDEANAKAASKNAEEVMTEADIARDRLSTNNTLLQALRAGKLQPGRLSELKTNYGSWLQAFGIKGETVDAATTNQTYQPLIEETRNNILRGNKGVQTEGDAQRTLSQIGNLKQTPEAFAATLQYASAVDEKKQLKSQFYQDFAAANNGRYKGAQAAWQASDVYKAPISALSSNGGLVFFPDYVKAFKKQYPDATMSEITSRWTEKAK